jgi:hypothetical protein
VQNNEAVATARATCPTHPDRTALGACTRCGTFVCKTCAAMTQPLMCAPCKAKVRALNAPQQFSFEHAFSGGWLFFSHSLGPLALFSIVFGAPSAVIEIYIHRAKLSPLASVMGTLLVGATLGLIGNIACLACMVGVAEGRTVSNGDALRSGLRSWGRVFGAQFLAGLWIGLASLLLIVPGVYQAVRLAVVVPAAYLDTSGDALQESRTLTDGKGWEVFAVLLVTGLVVLVPSVIVGAVMGVVGVLVPPLSIRHRVLQPRIWPARRDFLPGGRAPGVLRLVGFPRRSNI